MAERPSGMGERRRGDAQRSGVMMAVTMGMTVVVVMVMVQRHGP